MKLNEKVFTQQLNDALLDNISDYLFDDKAEISIIDTVPDVVDNKHIKKYAQLMDYCHENNLFDVNRFINIFAKLALYNKIQVSRTVDNDQPKYIGSINELMLIMKHALNVEAELAFGFFLVFEEMQCIVHIYRDTPELASIIYFHNEKYRAFVKNIVHTEGFYLR